MEKRVITTWWIWGTVVMFAGSAAALLVSFETDQGRLLNGKTGTSVALLALALSIAAIGVILQLVVQAAPVAGDRRDRDQPRCHRRPTVVDPDARLCGCGARW